jgi:hypothetical protein
MCWLFVSSGRKHNLETALFCAGRTAQQHGMHSVCCLRGFSVMWQTVIWQAAIPTRHSAMVATAKLTNSFAAVPWRVQDRWKRWLDSFVCKARSW